MKIQELTNNNNLPDFIVEALSKDSREDIEGVDYSVTQLIKPPRIVQLERRHKKEVSTDARDMWNVFVGHALHSALYEKLKENPDYIMEKTVFVEELGRKISGTPDKYQKSTKTLFDHKTMKTIAYGLEAKEEYEAQLNIYAWMLRKLGMEVTSLKINAMYLDWRLAMLKRTTAEEYPRNPIQVVDVPMWLDDKCREYFLARLANHISAEALSDNELPFCTDEEVWASPTKYAVGVPKAPRATKLCNTYEEAVEYVHNKKLDPRVYKITHRPGSRLRCESYCSAAPFCNQYQEWLKQNATN